MSNRYSTILETNRLHGLNTLLSRQHPFLSNSP
jgi:hypothetical protein